MILNSTKIKQMKEDYAMREGAALIGDANVSVFSLTERKHRILLPVSGSPGERVRVYLPLSFSGETGKYAQSVLTDEKGAIIDYGFLNGKTQPIFFNATVIEEGGKTYVVAYLVGGKGEKVTLFGAQIVGKPLQDKVFFGGGSLTMLEPACQQMMGFLYVTNAGKLIVIDGGNREDAPTLAKAIAQRGGVVDAWFITHGHRGHLGAVIGVLQEYDVQVRALYYDFKGRIDPEYVEKDDCCVEFEEVLAVTNKVERVVRTSRGDVIAVDETTVTLLNDGYFGAGENGCNNAGVAIKLQTAGDAILFLGDLGERGDEYLSDEWFVAQVRTCRVLQMSHHGYGGVSKRFYQAIDDIDLCLYSAGQWLFDAEKDGAGVGSGEWDTLVTRDWMRERGVEWSATSIDGTITLK